jgi:hypothetical protein
MVPTTVASTHCRLPCVSGWVEIALRTVCLTCVDSVLLLACVLPLLPPAQSRMPRTAPRDDTSSSYDAAKYIHSIPSTQSSMMQPNPSPMDPQSLRPIHNTPTWKQAQNSSHLLSKFAPMRSDRQSDPSLHASIHVPSMIHSNVRPAFSWSP